MIGRVISIFYRFTVSLGHAYQATLRWWLSQKLATLGVALATFVGSFFLIPILGAEFVPKADFSETQINFYTPIGSSLEGTEARARQSDPVLREVPEGRHTVITINNSFAPAENHGA